MSPDTCPADLTTELIPSRGLDAEAVLGSYNVTFSKCQTAICLRSGRYPVNR